MHGIGALAVVRIEYHSTEYHRARSDLERDDECVRQFERLLGHQELCGISTSLSSCKLERLSTASAAFSGLLKEARDSFDGNLRGLGSYIVPRSKSAREKTKCLASSGTYQGSQLRKWPKSRVPEHTHTHTHTHTS